MVIEILFYFFPNPLYPNMSLFQKLTYILHFHSLLHFSVFLFCLLFWYPSSNYFLPFFSVFISVNKSTFSLPLYMWRGVYQPSEKQTKLWLLFSQPAPVGPVLTHPSGNALGQNFLHLPLSQCPKSRISWPSTFSGSVPCTWNTEFGRFLLPLTLCVEAKHILLFLNYSAKSPFFSLYLIIEISRFFFPHIYFKCLFFLFSDIQTVLDSCLVSKLPLFFPIAAAKSMTFWWVFALLCIEKCTSWHGVTGCLQSEKDDTASLCTMVHVWKICGFFFFSFCGKGSWNVSKIHLLKESLDGAGDIKFQALPQVWASFPFLSFYHWHQECTGYPFKKRTDTRPFREVQHELQVKLGQCIQKEFQWHLVILSVTTRSVLLFVPFQFIQFK